jgi:hypothetical protein
MAYDSSVEQASADVDVAASPDQTAEELSILNAVKRIGLT